MCVCETTTTEITDSYACYTNDSMKTNKTYITILTSAASGTASCEETITLVKRQQLNNKHHYNSPKSHDEETNTVLLNF